MSPSPCRSTRGPRSRNFSGSHVCHRWGGSTTWSSTLTMRGISGVAVLGLGGFDTGRLLRACPDGRPDLTGRQIMIPPAACHGPEDAGRGRGSRRPVLGAALVTVEEAVAEGPEQLEGGIRALADPPRRDVVEQRGDGLVEITRRQGDLTTERVAAQQPV